MPAQRATLVDMAEAKRRILPIRFDEAVVDEIKRLAVVETEGNVSQMARKLVREALVARRARTQAEADSA